MTESSALFALVGAEFGVLLSLVGIVWAMLQTRIGAAEKQLGELQGQNTAQETQLGRLLERMKAREDAHAEHRETMLAQFSRLETSIAALGTKIDRIVGSRTPFPTRYGLEGGGEKGRGG